ncbi:hypothetical protein GH722_11060 [Alphaproteobacteria bacterium HT1-32]|jgi:lipopolysaccharide export system protein LptA|nr:hypothetical protein [Alphaproteobacteria bacterium HT1-32]
MAIRHWLFLAPLLLLSPLSGMATAAGLDLSGNGGGPIEVLADDGIEWEQDKKRFIARGNARASRGNVITSADILTAYYRETNGGGTDIHRLEAVGDVRIKSETDTAYGDAGYYDVDRALLVLTGRDLRLETATDKIYARDSLEYWGGTVNAAVARGAARAVSQGKTLEAGILTAFFSDKTGKNEISEVKAEGGVTVRTDSEVIKADSGLYDVKKGIVDLIGNVRITRGKNQLNGARGQVNLNTGKSRLFGGAQAGSSSRVKGMLVPKKPTE